MINRNEKNLRIYDPECSGYNFEKGTILRSALANHVKDHFHVDALAKIMKMDARTYHIGRITLYTSPSFLSWYIGCQRLSILSWMIPRYICLKLTNGNIKNSDNQTFLNDITKYKTLHTIT